MKNKVTTKGCNSNNRKRSKRKLSSNKYLHPGNTPQSPWCKHIRQHCKER